MKIVKKIGSVFFISFIVIQFFGPKKNITTTNHLSVFLEETNPPEDVREILENACYDCHSNNTVYPWYAGIVPISNWMADHVNVGKEGLNFSDWNTYSIKRKDHKLEELVAEIEEGEMPLKEYTWTHSEAKLNILEQEKIKEWAKRTRALYQLKLMPQ